MRYERSSPGAAADDRRPRRAAAAGLLVVLVAGAVIAYVASNGSSGSRPVGSVSAKAIEQVVLEAVVLEDDLGAPAPPGVTRSDWAVRSIAIRAKRSPASSSPLVAASYPWVGADGTISLLSSSAATALVAAQTRDIRAVAGGGFAKQLAGQLVSIVRREQRSDSFLSAPGGARAVEWLSVSITGGRATVDGQVEDWDEQLAVVGTSGHRRLSSSVANAEIETLATLERAGAGWRVVALDEKPYQQAT